jgi:hypothetical protein
MRSQTRIGLYTLARAGSEFRLTWIEGNSWNTLLTGNVRRIKSIIKRLESIQ